MLDIAHDVVYNNRIAMMKGGNTMNTDSYKKMVEDGRDFYSVLNSASEDKRFLVSAIAEAFLNGLNAGERNAGERLAQAQRPGA